MAARPVGSPGLEIFDAYFLRADLDRDGRISGAEAVAFFQGSNLPKQILAQIWMYSDSRKSGFLNQQEFYNALKLVTVAQSGRELTPEIVKAALEGPAAAKIPAPRINPVVASAPGNQISMQRPSLPSMSSPQVGTMPSVTSQASQFGGPQVLPNTNVNQLFPPSAGGQHLRPKQAESGLPTLPLAGQGIPTQLTSQSGPNLPTDWLGGQTAVPQGLGAATSATPVSQRVQMPSVGTSSLPSKSSVSLSTIQPSTSPQASAVQVNGFSSDSVFGGDMFSASTHPKQGTAAAASPASSFSSSPGIASSTSGLQPSVRPVQNNILLSSSTPNPGAGQYQGAQLLINHNQTGAQSVLAPAPSVVSVRAAGPSPTERAWPKFSPSDIQKYSRVFMEVDKDRDGKITGEEARELFLSWKLPREVLKQVWDLSDQDNDSMLSHREFVTALYLMERYREGYTLPAVLPNSIRFDETLLQATGQSSVSYGGVAWQPSPGFPQQRMPGPRPSIPLPRPRPHAHAREAPQNDVQALPVQQKPSAPVLDKHLIDQLSKDEQESLKSKYQEASDSDKKVQELEKEILDSKQKIEFYRTKMQELVLYKSRCDNRLNEITEKASADKREVNALLKKYEEKYKQVGDVASKLTIEEATFRDLQEKKLELYNAIIKMEHEGSADGVLQVRADRIQSDLEELVKSLNERCKKYGLHAKPTTLVELPFGWQPGIQEGTADWDEDWDKFEDEGFGLVKELTVDVKNVIAPPKTKPSPVESEKTNGKATKDEVDAFSVGAQQNGKPSSINEHINGTEGTDAHSEDGSNRSPPGSPPARSSIESPSQDFHSPRFPGRGSIGSPSGDFLSPKFGFQGTSPRFEDSKSDHGGAESMFSGERFADETSWGPTFDTNDDADSIWDFNQKDQESDFFRSKPSSFFDSGDFGLNPIRTESPSAASVFGKKERSPFFADSVPGTPLFNSGFSPRFNDGPEDHHSFDSFSKFDSFSSHDGGLFAQRDTLARFDSIRSTSDQSHAFSFDDADPFGSSGPFKSSDSYTSKRGSDNWSAF